MPGILTRLIGGDLAALAADPLGEFIRRSRQGGVVPLKIGLTRGHLVSDPALVRHVLLENSDNYDRRTPAFDALRVVLGNGLVTSGGAFWKRQRRIAQPAFSSESVRRFAPVITRLAAETADEWEGATARCETVDACTDMMRVTLRIVAEALFGDDLAGDAAAVNRIFPVILACLSARVASPIRPPVWVPTANNRRLRPALAALDSIVERLIATKRRRLADGDAAQDGHRDLLTILMLARDPETGEAMSDTQLRDEVMTFMIAGHETTATTLSWLWYLLDRHPEEQDRLRDELRAATGGRPPAVNHLPQLPRLKAVVQEALRLYPPLWLFDRRALGSDDLAGTKVAKGDLVIFCPYSIHRLPDLWPDPDAFRPERFEEGHAEQKNKFAYLPFSVGPRTCIGNNLAMIESQLIMGTLLSRFRARLADPAPITPRGRFTLRPSRPVELRLERAPLAGRSRRAAVGGVSGLHSYKQRSFGRLKEPIFRRELSCRSRHCDELAARGATQHAGSVMPGILVRLIGGDLAALTADALGEFVRRSRQGGVVPLRIGLARAHLVSDPALVRHVLLDNIDNYDKHTPAFDAVRVVLGNGMLTSGGAFWKRQRRIAQPAFHGESVRHFAPIISRLAAETADVWERAAAAGAPVDACTDMMKVTLRIVAETLFGDDLGGDADEVNRVFPVILACLASRVSSPLRPPLWLPTANNRRLRPALDSLNRIVERLIAMKRSRLAAGGGPLGGHRDLLTVLMLARDAETGEAMSDAQLRDEVMTLMIAGHETTANALSWLWYLLDRHPDEQERLRAELGAATGGRAPTVEDLPKLPRLKAVIQETLRLYPPVWMFDRRALGPDDLAGTRVAKGDLVIFCPYAIHRLPELWPDPDTFRPERFEAGREEHKQKFAYLPFSAGPRTCIGNSFAMIESQIIMGTLLARFRARLADPSPIKPLPRVTLRTSRPVELRLERAPLA